MSRLHTNSCLDNTKGFTKTQWQRHDSNNASELSEWCTLLLIKILGDAPPMVSNNNSINGSLIIHSFGFYLNTYSLCSWPTSTGSYSILWQGNKLSFQETIILPRNPPLRLFYGIEVMSSSISFWNFQSLEVIWKTNNNMW